MSADHDDREDDPARPARRANVGQYRKGTSGNPRGRPRKAVDQPAIDQRSDNGTQEWC